MLVVSATTTPHVPRTKNDLAMRPLLFATAVAKVSKAGTRGDGHATEVECLERPMARWWILASILLTACGGSPKQPAKPAQGQPPAASSSVLMPGIDDDIPPPLDVDDEEH
jgi:hypothetical protein